MKKTPAFLFLLIVSGCTTVRPPIVEDKVGLWLREKVGTLATAPDYSITYVNIETGKFCAQGPADVATQISGTIAAAISAPIAQQQGISAEMAAALATAAKQLAKRSQGGQLYRDGVFALCNAYLNGIIEDRGQYFQELQTLRETASELIKAEIQYIKDIPYDNPPVPQPPPIPQIDPNSRGGNGSGAGSKNKS